MLAATLAAGAAAYGLAGPSKADPGKLAAAMAVPIEQGTVTLAGAGDADAAAASTTGGAVGGAVAHPAMTSRSAMVSQPPAQPSQVAVAEAQARPAPSNSAVSQPTPAATPSASATPTASAATVSCSDASALLPANVTAIVSFLLANGYSDNAVAGIAGNIYQESKGDPEAVGMGGGGLIGFTPLPSGYVTGDPSADLQTQLTAILTFNNELPAYIPELNAAASPADAADIYVTDFERAGIPAAATREASAQAVATACDL